MILFTFVLVAAFLVGSNLPLTSSNEVAQVQCFPQFRRTESCDPKPVGYPCRLTALPANMCYIFS